MLRSVCDCLFLCASLPLYRPESARTEELLQEYRTETMGLANELVYEMLWWGERLLENA
jgi:hypothetical protein